MACPRTARVRHLPGRVLEGPSKKSRLLTAAGVGILILLSGQGCKPAGKSAVPITITLLDQNWPDEESRRHRIEEFRRFTSKTGIRVELLPSPEASTEQLLVWRKLLENHATVPDVYAVDVVWPAILGDHLLDLKPYLSAQEIGAHFPKLIENFTMDGRLVALPNYLNVGLLYYRTDLLRKYGYSVPPKTWEELEKAAARIQAGERAEGHKQFWGFMWQGAPSETLTCNALEWQMSEGGGSILENGVVTVNNPRTIRAWERAARWPGSISPPGVVAYRVWDAFNRWQSGEAAFMHSWSNGYLVARAQNSPVRYSFGICPLPRGSAARIGTLGGSGYGVSRYSVHPREAVMLVRFLSGRDEQYRRSQDPAEPPTIPELYNNPSVLAANPYFSDVLQIYQNHLGVRPSALTGKMYPDVSRAYFEAVHAVITHRKTAETAAAELQRELTQITGFKESTAAQNGGAVQKTTALGR